MSSRRPFIGNKKAVSEVIGTILILLISVSMFSVVYAAFFSIDSSPATPAVRIVGTIRNNNLIFDHKGGDMLDLKTKIILDYANDQRVEIRADESNYMTDPAKADGFWDIGENFKFDLSTLQSTGFNRFDPLDVMVVDIDSNSVVMMGSISESRAADLDLNYVIADREPQINKEFTFTVKVENTGHSETDDVKVSIDLPDDVSFNSFTGEGTYNKVTGIWDVGYLGSETEKLKQIDITATPTSSIQGDPVQMIFILDGSSNSTSAWSSIKTGISDSIRNGRIPHSNVELTVVQYGLGQSSNYHSAEPILTAKTFVGPVELTDSNYNTIANNIDAMPLMGGNCPMDAGILRAKDELKTVLEPSHKQIVCFIVSGLADAYVHPDDEIFYKATRPRYNQHYWGKIAAEARRDDLVSNLQMTSDQDKIDIILNLNPYLVTCPNLDNPWNDQSNVTWLTEEIAWPMGSQYSDYSAGWVPSTPGWVVGVPNSADIQSCIGSLMDVSFTSRTIRGEIVNSLYNDPDLSNNYFDLEIWPKP